MQLRLENFAYELNIEAAKQKSATANDQFLESKESDFMFFVINGFSLTLSKNEDILSAENLSSKLTIKRLKCWLIDIILVCYSG